MVATATTWRRLRRGEACAVCGHPGWCTVTSDGAAANCMRTPNSHPIHGRNGECVGYLHKIDGTQIRVARPSMPSAAPVVELSHGELVLIQRGYSTALSPDRAVRFSVELGVTLQSLARLDVGYSHDKRAHSFPMRDGRGERITGIRLRSIDPEHRKFSVKGGHEGLFIPFELSGNGPLLICEGPTSCAALLDLSFDAIGRPSCTGGVSLILEFLQHSINRKRLVVVLGDHDEAKTRPDGSVFYPGQEGGDALARRIASEAGRDVKLLVPPRHKDARDWKKAGATHGVIEAVIQAANYVRRGGIG